MFRATCQDILQGSVFREGQPENRIVLGDAGYIIDFLCLWKVIEGKVERKRPLLNPLSFFVTWLKLLFLQPPSINSFLFAFLQAETLIATHVAFVAELKIWNISYNNQTQISRLLFYKPYIFSCIFLKASNNGVPLPSMTASVIVWDGLIVLCYKRKSYALGFFAVIFLLSDLLYFGGLNIATNLNRHSTLLVINNCNQNMHLPKSRIFLRFLLMPVKKMGT